MKSDAELMLDFQAGEAEAFEKLVLRHQTGLLNFFARMTNDAAGAEDLTQEVFLRVYRHADGYEPTAKFATYLYRIARNCWIDSVRKHKRRGKVVSLDKTSEAGQPYRDALECGDDGPVAAMERNEQGRAIEEALAKLPEEQRLVFVLSEVQGMKYAEIGETLGVPVGTVKSRMHVAVRRLRDLLEQAGIVAEG